MSKITGIDSNEVKAEYKNIKSSWPLKISKLNSELSLLVKFAAFKNYHFLNGNSIFDSDDMDSMNAVFTADFLALKTIVDKLTEISEIPNADLAVYEANNNKFITDNNINLIDFSKRYEV